MSNQKHGADLPPPVLITEPPQLARLMDRLSEQRAIDQHPVIAVDTESNSLHAYQEQVCLIQLSIPGADLLIDPLSGLDLNPLEAVFADPRVEKVFHAAEYDVICLRRDYGWRFANLFDTMWAARVLGWPRTGLGNILEEHFDVRLNKRWQRHDWGRRPLSSEALTYARLDTHYLLPLRDQMVEALKRKGRLAQAQDFFRQVAQAEPNFRAFNPDEDLWRVKGVWDLIPRERAILRELLIWRDDEARRRDRPPFKVLNDRTLVRLAQIGPRSSDQMEGVKGFKEYHRRRYGQGILRAVARGFDADLPSPPPRSSRPPDEVLERYEALRRWRKKPARRQGTDPDVIVSNAVLWTLARQVPRSLDELARLNLLGPWTLRTFGEAMLQVLHRQN